MKAYAYKAICMQGLGRGVRNATRRRILAASQVGIEIQNSEAYGNTGFFTLQEIALGALQLKSQV